MMTTTIKVTKKEGGFRDMDTASHKARFLFCLFSNFPNDIGAEASWQHFCDTMAVRSDGCSKKLCGVQMTR
eukprot:2962965-Ditylum_brightwellii.AAC.1